MSKQKQKESLSVMIAKTVLAIAVITGLGTIIIGGGVLIMKYYNGEVNNRVVKAENCGKDIQCFKKAIQNCQAGVTGESITEDNTANIYTKSTWYQKVIGEENGMCKTYRKAVDKVYMNNEERENTVEYYIYYKIGDSSEIVKSERIKKELSTSDWQTYRNEEFGFEVKYPAYLDVHERDGKIRFFYGHGDITISASKKVGIEEAENYKCVTGEGKPIGTYSHDITSYGCSEIQSKNEFDIFKISYRSGHWNGSRKIYNLIKKIDDENFVVVVINTQEMSADGIASSLKIIE